MAEMDVERLIEEVERRRFGKYLGRVVGNKDEDKRGSIEVVVPKVLGKTSVWALPCVPYAGKNVGFFAIPPVGTGVWIEFEAGDTNHPIWTGCLWAPGEVADEDADPGVFFWRTPAGFIRFNESEGTIEIETQGGCSIVLSGSEITIDGQKIKSTAMGGSTELSASGFDAMNGALKVM